MKTENKKPYEAGEGKDICEICDKEFDEHRIYEYDGMLVCIGCIERMEYQ
jgi:formylmethanofuran dehydrogenase subunit E